MASGQIRKVVYTAAICAALGLDAATTWQVNQSTGNDAAAPCSHEGNDRQRLDPHKRKGDLECLIWRPRSSWDLSLS